MQKEPVLQEEKSLDPADWTALKQLGHRMLDEMEITPEVM